jgi:hypothetical protein
MEGAKIIHHILLNCKINDKIINLAAQESCPKKGFIDQTHARVGFRHIIAIFYPYNTIRHSIL